MRLDPQKLIDNISAQILKDARRMKGLRVPRPTQYAGNPGQVDREQTILAGKLAALRSMRKSITEALIDET